MATKIYSSGGNLAKDPELKFTPSGRAVVNFTVLEQPRKRNQQTNEWENNGELNRFECEAWGKLAENIADSFRKGDPVLLEATQYNQSWKDKETGATRYKNRYVTDNLTLDTKRSTFQRTQQNQGNQGGQGNWNDGQGNVQNNQPSQGNWNSGQNNQPAQGGGDPWANQQPQGDWGGTPSSPFNNNSNTPF